MHARRTKTTIALWMLLFTALRMDAAAQSPSAAGVEQGLPQSQERAVPSSELSPRSRLSGIVVDVSGAAIAGAAVEVLSADDASKRVTLSGGDGAFTVSGVEPGHYRVIVSHSNFGLRELQLRWTSSETPPHVYVSLPISTVVSTVQVEGREDDLTGIAESASQGTVGARQLEDRPILRSGEILESVPGMMITQHAGGGKANQYFLRGFNLDHGTDFAIFTDDMPLNLPSHAHGEGYADMNTVIPEFVRRINYEKGPYYADVGNYGSAGSAHLELFRKLPQNFVHWEGGMYGFGRLVFGASHPLGSGDLMYGGEAYHDDGPWTHPDNYFKFNGILTYSQGEESRGFSVTARGYRGTWHSSDQIAANAVPLVGYFGTLDPTDGGRSQRYSVQGEWHRVGANSLTKVSTYGFRYDLDLFSNFTYYLTDTVRGDQFEQQDGRWVAGLDAHHTIFSEWGGRKVQNTFGLQLRNDWIHNGLFQDENRVRVAKMDSSTGSRLPATTEADRFSDTQAGLYVENRVQWAAKFRSVLGLRGDLEHFHVTSLVTSANSGISSKLLPGPKATLIFGPWENTEFYAQAGSSFHSNDGRGTTQTIAPVSAENPYPNTRADKIPALIPTKGAELGMRTAAIPHLQSTVSVWYLHSASELQQSGDTGGTTASRQPSDRYGVEWANYYSHGERWAVDFDLAQSKALFAERDPDDAAPGSKGGRLVPEAVGLVISSGIAMRDYKGLSSGLRLRYFGPRDLTSDAAYRSRATALLNGELGYGIGERWRVSAQFLNLLNRRDHDIDYAYQSRVTPTAAPAFTNVFHPVEPFQVRFSLGTSF